MWRFNGLLTEFVYCKDAIVRGDCRPADRATVFMFDPASIGEVEIFGARLETHVKGKRFVGLDSGSPPHRAIKAKVGDIIQDLKILEWTLKSDTLYYIGVYKTGETEIIHDNRYYIISQAAFYMGLVKGRTPYNFMEYEFFACPRHLVPKGRLHETVIMVKNLTTAIQAIHSEIS